MQLTFSKLQKGLDCIALLRYSEFSVSFDDAVLRVDSDS